MFSDYTTSMPGLDNSPHSTPYMEVDTPFTPPFFDTSDITLFSNPTMLKQDVCLSGYLKHFGDHEGAMAEFNGDPTELLIDKSKTPQWPSYSFDVTYQQHDLFPPLGDSPELSTFDDILDLEMSSPASEPPKLKHGRKRKSERTAKAYQCPHCDHVSKRRYNLTTHIKTHNKQRVKEFECSQCLKRFDRRHDRDRHLATVHRGKRAFICQFCSVQFSRVDALNRHLDQQHDNDDYD